MGLDDFEVVSMDISSFRGSCGFDHVTGGASTCSPCFWGVIVFGMHADGFRIGKLLVLSVAGETKGIVGIRFDHLELARPSMGIVAVKAEGLGLEVCALLVINPLLVMGLGMGFRISPQTRFKLKIFGKGFS